MGRGGLEGKAVGDEKDIGQVGWRYGKAVSMAGCDATGMGAGTGQDSCTVQDTTGTRLHAETGHCAGEKVGLQVLTTAAACKRVVSACMSMTRPVRS